MASGTEFAPDPFAGFIFHPLVRPLLITAVLIVPALVLRFGGLHLNPVISLLIYGAAVVSASFLLAWAAEAAQVDVSGGLAIAVLALIAVLPEYAVDLYYAYTAGQNPDYTQYAAANMTGSNRLLMGIGWPVVVLVSLYVARKVSGPKGERTKTLMAGSAGVRGAGVHHRDHLHRARQGHRGHRDVDLLESQPVDATDGIAADRLYGRWWRDGAGYSTDGRSRRCC